MPKYAKWAVVALVAVLTFFAVRSCGGPSAKYYVRKALYDQAVAEAAVQHEADLALVAAKDAAIVERDAAIAAKQAEVDSVLADARDSQAATGGLRAANRKLREDAQAAIDANPTLQALIRNFDLTIETQEKTISDLLDAIDLKDGQIADWKTKYDAQVVISDTWKAAYDRERGLRLTSDSLRASLERGAKADDFAKKSGDVEGVGVGVYSAVRYKDPIPLAGYAGKKLAVMVWRLFHGRK